MIRRILTVVVLCVSLAVPALAAKGSGVRKFQKTLGLTSDQTTQLQSLLTERDRQLAALNAAGKGKGQKKEARAIKEQFRSSFRAILTPEQAERFAQRTEGKKK